MSYPWTNNQRLGNPINLADIGNLVGDGTTDNHTAFLTTQTLQKALGLYNKPATVTITIASPGVINWTGHGARIGDPIVFFTTGALPTGLTAGTIYYVSPTGLTADAFSVTTTDPWTALILNLSAPTNINFTGTQSGTQTAVNLCKSYQKLQLPPGYYHTTSNIGVCGGQKFSVYECYGATSDQWSFGAYGLGFGYDGFTYATRTVSAFINSVAVKSTTVTLAVAADASKFWVGGWILVYALDLQDQFGSLLSGPANPAYCEFHQIQAIDAGTGVITLGDPETGGFSYLRNSYLSTFPTFFNDPSSTQGIACGAAAIAPICPAWDTVTEIRGLHCAQSTQSISSARSIKYVDCLFDGQGAIPSVNKEFIAERCQWGSNDNLEIDKIIEYARFKECRINELRVQSTSIDRLIVDGCHINLMSGTSRNTHIRDSDIYQLDVGPLAFGATESLLIENCRISQIQEAPRLDSQAGQPSEFGNLLNGWTFSNGTLKQSMVTTAGNAWAVPGRRMQINDMANTYDSMGSPFAILDVYMTQDSTHTVTIDIASPAVIHWTGHGLTAGTVVSFTTTGLLPTGLVPSTPYYVIAAGLAADTFEVSATPGGAAINTSGTQSGTHTAYANPTFAIDTTLTSLPTGPTTTSPVTIDIATPCVIHWTGHGLPAGTPVCFQTTGALPTGLSTTVLYYVIAAGLAADSFEVSTSVGGSAVNTSGSQSGTQTAIANPLKFKPMVCPRLTVRNSTGCALISDMSAAPEGLPIWSYSRRLFAGYVGALPSYIRHPYVFGTLVSMTINVLRASTASGTLNVTLTANGFDSSLNASNMSEVIDLKTAGTRVITPTAATGGAGADSIAAYAGWISGQVKVQYGGSASPANLAATATWELIIQTDQGAYAFPSSMMAGGVDHPHPLPLSDTTILATGA